MKKKKPLTPAQQLRKAKAASNRSKHEGAIKLAVQAAGMASPVKEFRFAVMGVPVGKPRMTQRDKWAKRPCVMRYRAWADSCREAAGNLPDANSIVRLDWVAYFEPPKSWSNKRRLLALWTLHRVKPDRDNIDKAVLDALFPDGDSAIAAGTLEKKWGVESALKITIIYK